MSTQSPVAIHNGNPEVTVAHNVLIISASMGAGHDGAARELAARLTTTGHQVEVRDFLSAFPIGFGWFLRWLYGRMLALAPWTYDAVYKIFPMLYWPFSFAEHHLTRRSLKRWIRTSNPDVIVSTYPLASLALGRMRMGGKLKMPVITYITDFHAFPLVTHEGVDLHLAIHDITRRGASKRITGPVHTCSPLVSSRFNVAPGVRDAKRAELNIADNQTVVLVVAGSWGVGEIQETVLDLIGSNDVVPVVICGRNEELLARVSAIAGAVAIGWTKEMPELMAAADVIIDNAGGLTAMEAMRANLPIISYRPMAGHGLDNALDMESAGVVTLAHSAAELAQAVSVLGVDSEQRALQIENGRAMFGVDALDDVLAYASGRKAPVARVVPIKSVRKVTPRRKRIASVAAVGALAISFGLTTGVGEATAHGIGSDTDDYTTATYVGVRVTNDELADPRIQAQIKDLPVTLIVDGPTAAENADALRALAYDGTDVANGGSGRHDPGWAPWTRARLDVVRSDAQITASTGVSSKTFVPGRRLDGFDLLFSRHMHDRALPATKIVKLGDERSDLTSHGVYIIDGRGESPNLLFDRLSAIQTSITQPGSDIHPLSSIR